MATKQERILVEVRESRASTPDSPSWLTVVTTSRGWCYFAIYAGDKPSVEKVRQDWLDDRNTSRAKNWSPYNS